jgi:signal transduction histidine kinase
LPLVRSLVHLHGGDIRVTSDINRGTLVELIFPERHPASE